MKAQFPPTLPAGACDTRRAFLRNSALLAAFFIVPGAFAEALTLTPRQTEGPFYPDKLPLDTDNDLLVINDAATPALGEVTWLHGRVLDGRGDPIRNALVEIWQCDANGVYLHSGDDRQDRKDQNFQSFGRFLTGSTGEYQFRTIKPVSYPGRTPHIHLKVKRAGKELLVTQCYIAGEPRNEKDSIYRSVKDEKARASITVPFVPLPGSAADELHAQFDVVLGLTPGA
ncbi:MAG TPA: intradiol ring-cleavage dioxygenase [Verrucomicrobiales bacterium]|nr:intradiol ring-cleavage dioxygenase [Verrucomicrobiales bacterium]